ncbi:MAG: NAD-dependent epimerase/dehydratase family protein [Promethearchaeota archaeon]
MKILVTGGLGFIGSHIVDELIKQGHQVRVLDNLVYQVHKGKFPEYANKKAEYIIGNVLDPNIFEIALKDIEVVFHEAAMVGMGQSLYEIFNYTNVNVTGTALLLDKIVNGNFPIKKLIVAASMSSYGEGLYECENCGPISPPMRSESQLNKKEWELSCPNCKAPLKPLPTPESNTLDSLAVYSLNKKYQEELCMSVGKTYGIPVVSLRYFNVYGPRQSLSNPYTGVAAIFTSRIKNGNPPYIYEDGLQSRDFIHVEDVARINALVMNSTKANNEIINVGVQNPITIKDLALKLIKKMGKNIKPIISNQGRQGDVRHCFADISKLRKLNYSFIHPEIDINDLIKWSQNIKAEDQFDEARRELESKVKRK